MIKLKNLILALVAVLTSFSSMASEGPTNVENRLPKYIVSPYYNKKIVDFTTLTAPKLNKLFAYNEPQKTWVNNFAQAQALEKVCLHKLMKGIPSTTNALEGLENSQILALLQRRVSELSKLRNELATVLENAASAALALDTNSRINFEIATLLGKLDVEIEAVSGVVRSLQPEQPLKNWVNPLAALPLNVSSALLLDGSAEKEESDVRPMQQDIIAAFMKAVQEDSVRKDAMLAALKTEQDAQRLLTEQILGHHANPDLNPRLIAQLAKALMVAQAKGRELEETKRDQLATIEDLEELTSDLRASKSRRNWVIGLMTLSAGAAGCYFAPAQTWVSAQALAMEVGKTEAFTTLVRFLGL